MPKNIVFCADGTWNGLGAGDAQDLQADATNVLRLFAALAGTVTSDSLRKQDEQEKVATGADGEVTQIAKYLHGVGDSKNGIRKLLGGVFGEGFIERIVRGYTFLSRNYEPGDRIYLAGFSRGAYTVRALGGMVTKMGLLPQDAMRGSDGSYDADKAYKLGVYIWAAYRRAAGKHSTLLGYLEEFKAESIDLDKLVQGVGIEAIGVWDTVGALGVPVYDLADASKVDIFEFADKALSAKVRSGFHALAMDEQRSDFEPTLWDDRDGVHQRWFCGAHADVGGGYPTQELSTFSLDWMIGRLRDSGVAISPQYKAADSFTFGPIHTPYEDPPFKLRPHAPRQYPGDALFHPSVQIYLSGFAGYQPVGLGPLLTGRQLDPSVVSP
ncbi:DUF2235 domain-containing protein [Variovorax sp. J2P1-59]|uniref:DUF2235 domain-containing protein n=1 Tax=Variovorax flavidus TaxID=3053501 RepID=UPI002574DF86|nr:DUF2235 domain-containing protein [Variovorax sp. J2P1-59]MDM0074009.1 DUF2235 domain-containing protein [Variovorax sp. J2P1-59]